MRHTSSLTLKRLAALVWYIGVVTLIVKSTNLFVAAHQGGTRSVVVLTAVLGGLGMGLVKARYLFVKVCRKNLKRIEALETPRPWQFYQGRFYIFLGSMVLLGVYLGRQAQENEGLLIPLAIVELSVAVALLASSYCFWRDK